MSQFSNQFVASMEADHLSQQAIHDATEISQGALSRYCSATNRPPVDQFEKLLKCFTTKQRIALLLAYLADEVPPSFRNLVVIQPAAAGIRVSEQAPVYRSRMPRELREAYDGLGVKALEHPEVAESLIATWRIIGPRDEGKK